MNRKRVQRLMRLMGIEAIYPKPRTTWPGAGHKIYPYFLRNVEVTRSNQVWASDITYVPMAARVPCTWWPSSTGTAATCWVGVVQHADAELLPGGARRGAVASQARDFNTDQGSQFTAEAFTDAPGMAGVAISMDGRGRAMDNVFIERLWRSVKYEDVYLRDYTDGWHAEASLAEYFRFYNQERIHQALGYRTPLEVYRDRGSSEGPAVGRKTN